MQRIFCSLNNIKCTMFYKAAKWGMEEREVQIAYRVLCPSIIFQYAETFQPLL